jgi:hypothetical protein
MNGGLPTGGEPTTGGVVVLTGGPLVTRGLVTGAVAVRLAVVTGAVAVGGPLVAGAPMMVFRREAVQVTVAPPPLPEPLH